MKNTIRGQEVIYSHTQNTQNTQFKWEPSKEIWMQTERGIYSRDRERYIEREGDRESQRERENYFVKRIQHNTENRINNHLCIGTIECVACPRNIKESL